MQRDDALLLDIIKAAKAIRRFKKSARQSDFLKNELLQSGILHQLITVGEAVKQLSAEFRSIHTSIPWKLIAGMRDRLTHGYFDVDLEEVWKTAEKDIPTLIKLLSPLTPKKK